LTRPSFRGYDRGEIKARKAFFLRKNHPQSGKLKSMFNYIKEVRGELKHVAWPTRAQIIAYSVVVIAISLAVAVYLGLLDYLFSAMLKNII